MVNFYSDCLVKINDLKNGNLSDDFVSLMTKALEEHLLWDTGSKQIIELVRKYYENGGNPNITFPLINIGENTYRDLTLFHVLYLYWKKTSIKLDFNENNIFVEFIDQLLDDPRTDLGAKFSEESLCDSEHFFNFKKETYIDQHIEQGYLIEKMNIAHFAVLISDILMLDKLLERSPFLLNSTCCITKGKNLLNYDVLSMVPMDGSKPSYIQKKINPNDKDSLNLIKKYIWNPSDAEVNKLYDLDDEVYGIIANASVSLENTQCLNDIFRIAIVSLQHLAARIGNKLTISYLFGRKVNTNLVDSYNQTPLDYFRLSLTEQLIKENSYTKIIFDQLKPVLKFSRTLPPTNLVLQKTGYLINYDTSKRVATYVYERLDKKSLSKNTDRNSSHFSVDKEIPKLNRSELDDYKNSGYHRGHLVPAGDSTSSENGMNDTFMLSNIAPQKPEFNLGYWKRVEAFVRDLAETNDLIEVYTGGIYAPQIDSNQKAKISYELIGNNYVAVATHFFKVIYIHNQSTTTQAYLIPHCKIDPQTPLKQFDVSIDTIQQLSGILFKK